jgi:hypothetical protein
MLPSYLRLYLRRGLSPSNFHTKPSALLRAHALLCIATLIYTHPALLSKGILGQCVPWVEAAETGSLVRAAGYIVEFHVTWGSWDCL